MVTETVVVATVSCPQTGMAMGHWQRCDSVAADCQRDKRKTVWVYALQIGDCRGSSHGQWSSPTFQQFWHHDTAARGHHQTWTHIYKARMHLDVRDKTCCTRPPTNTSLGKTNWDGPPPHVDHGRGCEYTSIRAGHVLWKIRSGISPGCGHPFL
jgi:hypothetical protein